MIQSATWPALGTTARLLVHDGDAEPARTAVVQLLEEVDRTYSRFRPDSELTAVNTQAGHERRVSPLLAEALGAALRAAAQTNGLVDPTIGRAMRLVGYDDDFGRITSRSSPPIVRFEPVAGWRVVRLERSTRILGMPAGIELDLGSTGKALAADLAASAAHRATGRGGVLVSLGGDIAIAGAVPPGGWPVLVTEDSAAPADGPGQVVALRSGAIATSSTTVRRWLQGGVPVHHLLDPRTGRPAGGPWRTVSAIAATCVEANTAATAAIIQGSAALAWLERLGLAARLVATDGQVSHVGSWPAPAPALSA